MSEFLDLNEEQIAEGKGTAFRKDQNTGLWGFVTVDSTEVKDLLAQVGLDSNWQPLETPKQIMPTILITVLPKRK